MCESSFNLSYLLIVNIDISMSIWRQDLENLQMKHLNKTALWIFIRLIQLFFHLWEKNINFI